MDITRRDALRSGTAGLVAIASTGAAAATVPAIVHDPLPALVQGWFDHRDYIDNDLCQIVLSMESDASNKIMDSACAELSAEADAITQMPARTVAGAAAKLRLFVEQANMWDRPDWWGDDPQDDLAISVLRDLERLAGEVSP